jgi:aminoglycoside 6'-N-acetyltransferase
MVEPIRTDRLILRDFRLDDETDAFRFFGDPEVTHYLPWPTRDWEESVAELRRFAAETVFSYGEWTRFAIEVAATARLAGGVVVRIDSETDRQAEIGWWLSRDAQGHGYGYEAVRAAMAWAVRRGAHRLFARADVRNEPSIRLMERLGMRREGVFRECQFAKGEWIDLAYYAVLAREFDAPPASRAER